MIRNIIPFSFLCICVASSHLCAQETRTGRKEATWSHTGHESREHSWSYGKACNNVRRLIEEQFGPDWRLEEISYEDLGRETDTDHKWTSERRWEVDHTVAGNYKMVRRGKRLVDAKTPRIESVVKVEYQMANPFYHADNKPIEVQSLSNAIANTQHAMKHRHTEIATRYYSHEETFRLACLEAYSEIFGRHCGNGDFLKCKISEISFHDQGRTISTEQVTPNGNNPTKYTHSITAVYKIAHFKSERTVRGDEKFFTWSFDIKYDMMNPFAELR